MSPPSSLLLPGHGGSGGAACGRGAQQQRGRQPVVHGAYVRGHAGGRGGRRPTHLGGHREAFSALRGRPGERQISWLINSLVCVCVCVCEFPTYLREIVRSLM